ncbi:glycoside hydrolase family 25 protein [Mucilaginibacter galii]|uniref:Lysozyme n=1 Tax=Mucilaginibacter galii TaxID=2005073 RepID=A0A917N293_9SPHI|nr:glycoside hydrolase family 25 protein [Mucilaginibacter galii]GGI51696.1 lysozyme [Mucilaginibacter galii]
MPPRKTSPGQLLKKREVATSKPSAKSKISKNNKAVKNIGANVFRWKVIAITVLLILLSPFYYGYILKFFASSWRWVSDLGSSSHYRTYQSFGIRIPTRYHIHGIDVSYAQGKINWPKVKAMKEDHIHITFAFIKATEGLLTVDPYFKRNWREAPKVGIRCGAYHFFRPKKNGLWQARFFLQNVKIESGDLPAVVDIERLDGVAPAAMRNQLHNFLNHVQTKTHVKPIIYTGLSFYKDYLEGYYDDYPLWIAHYNREELKAGANTNWWFWQHSETGKVNGINHAVDFNVFKGDSLQFERFLMR